MMDEEREGAKDDANSGQAKKSSDNSPMQAGGAGGSKETKATEPVLVDSSFMGRISRLIKGDVKEGDTATATLLAEAIDEAVEMGQLGHDKLTVAELQLLDDISRGSVVCFLVLSAFKKKT